MIYLYKAPASGPVPRNTFPAFRRRGIILARFAALRFGVKGGV